MKFLRGRWPRAAGITSAVLIGTALLTPGVAQAAAPDYVALGDSYAAGQGGGTYLDTCAHTAAAYPLAVDELRGVRLKDDQSCTGATSRDLVQKQIPWTKRNLKKAELVTITVGINDLLSERVTAYCDPEAVDESRHAAKECWKAIKHAIHGVGYWLYKGLKKIDHLNDDVKILVTGYPRFFSSPDGRFQHVVNAAADKLNKTLRHTVDKAQDHGIHVKFVKVAGLFAGHLIDDPFPWIHADGPDVFHPTADGHGAYAHLVTEKVLRLF